MINLMPKKLISLFVFLFAFLVFPLFASADETPPELSSDIIDKGIVMSGGTSTLRNFDKLMTDLTGVPCHVAEEPLLCVARGTGVALENLDLYKKSITQK